MIAFFIINAFQQKCNSFCKEIRRFADFAANLDGKCALCYLKRFAVLLLTLALAVCCTLPAFAADTIEVNEDVSVSGDYDWTRFKGQNVTLNVYNWGEYISNGSDDSVDVVAAFA